MGPFRLISSPIGFPSGIYNSEIEPFPSALPANSYVGLVAFHGRVQKLADLTLMEDRDSWQVLKQRLWREKLHIGTSIGGALKMAISLLKNSGPTDLRDSGGF